MANNIVNPDTVSFVKKDENPLAENGRNNSILKEPDNQFIYNKADCETYIPSDGNQRNTYIVFGRDRPSGWDTGYGGKGHEKSSAIDIVVGRLSSIRATEHLNEYVNPSIGADASRIYLSQKADIDDYYGISDGRTGNSKARAAIAIKSDDIRIVARNTIKIVTERDSKLSANDPNFISTGVQLIANNDSTNMQAIPRGGQLVKFIWELQQNILELNGLICGFMEIQNRVNISLGSHVHLSPFFGNPTSPSIPLLNDIKEASLQMNIKVAQGLKNHVNNLGSIIFKYTNGGPEHINSSFHYLN